MNISVLIPFRGDDGQRDRLWAYCRALWAALPYELVVGTPDDGPFNAAQAFNRAAAAATGDIFILYGADQIPDPDRIEWAAQQLATHKWCALYDHTAGISAADTEAILAGAPVNNFGPAQLAPFCTAIIGIRADSWVQMDERFHGWGGEDTAWRMALEGLYGPTPEPSGTLRCLFHEPASREHTDHNFGLIGEYMAAQEAGLLPKYVKALGLV